MSYTQVHQDKDILWHNFISLWIQSLEIEYPTLKKQNLHQTANSEAKYCLFVYKYISCMYVQASSVEP